VKRLIVFLAAALPAAAADVRVDGSYRLRFNTESNYLLDDTGLRLGQKEWLEHRLRITPKIVEQDVIEVQGSFDVLSGLVGGDLAPNFQDLGWQGRAYRDGIHTSGFEFRHLFAKLRMPFGVFEFGQMPNDWGMGLFMNGGNQENAFDFGDERFGDIVDRVLFATRPFGFLGPRSEIAEHVALAVGAGLVYRDRYASMFISGPDNSQGLLSGGGLSWGDIASEVVAALVWDPSPGSRAGLYLARRWQDFALGLGSMRWWLVDLHGRTLLPVGSLGVLSLEVEAVEIYGSTTHSPNLSGLRTQIAQQGAAGRAVLSRGTIEAEVEAGYASGDSNPFDDVNTQFQFNRDYKVGLVLFDEVILFQTQNSARRLADPNLFARPLAGIEQLPSQGAVTNAIYLKPTVRWRPSLLGGRLRLTGSVLFARAAEPYIDPYSTYLASAPVNVFGAPAGRDYGVEIDAGASWRVRLGGTVAYELGVQAGRLFPGNAFQFGDGSRLSPVNAARFRATLEF
jgi:hypothetical protein